MVFFARVKGTVVQFFCGVADIRSAALMLSFALFIISREAGAELLANAEMGAVYDDNLTRAVDREDRKADIAAVARVSIGQHIQPGDSTGLFITANIEDAVYDRYSGLDRREAGLTISMKYKAGLGSYATWISVSGSAAYDDYRESMQSGPLTTLGLQSGKRIAERMFAQAGYTYDDRNARNAAFKTAGSTLSIRGDYLLTESTQLSLGYAVRWGTSVMYEPVEPGGPYGSSEGVVVNTFNTPMEAYPVRTDTRTLSISECTMFDKKWSTVIGIDRHEARAEGNRYPDTLVRAALSYAY
jgi:hypothetical protein